jgi:hypothetical protein
MKLHPSKSDVVPTAGGVLIRMDPTQLEELYGILDSMNDNDRFAVSVTRAGKRKTGAANAYMWKLADLIAKKTGTTSTEVYRKAVGEVGPYSQVIMDTGAVERFTADWTGRGIAWPTETIDTNGQTTLLRLYYGSGSYDREELARVIDLLVEDARVLGIGVETREYIGQLLEDVT